MDGRNQAFQRLKPPCVALSQAALALSGPSANTQLVAERLENLNRELEAIVSAQIALDPKLADYVFFPLSQVLKVSQRVSIRCLELAFQCLAILINRGWRAHIQDQLGAQVVILCTLMAEKKPRGLACNESTDELQASALWCLHHLFSALGDASESRARLILEANLSQLGQTISTILDAIQGCGSVDGQIAGIHALQILVKSGASRQAQAAFLPGVVSKLTKVLIPHSAQRRNHAVIIGALEILSILFSNTLSESAQDLADPASVLPTSLEVPPVSGDKWLKAAATQLKPALMAILRLKDHGRLDVKEAVAQLCFVTLKDCRKSLESCASMALETILTLASEQSGDAIKFRIEALSASDPGICALAQDFLHGWLQSLTTEMQTADDHAKVRRLQQIRTVYDIIAGSGANISTIDHVVSSTLRDSVAIILRACKYEQHKNVTAPVQSLDVSPLSRMSKSMEFESTLVRARGGQMVIETFKQLLEAVQSSSNSVTFSADLARSLHQTQDDMHLATFWLLLNATEMALRSQNEVDTLLAVDIPTSKAHGGYLEELYSFSLGILSGTSDTFNDTRLKALALRTLALRARIAGPEFRFELIDALYPVLHTIASPDEQLQHDSVITLNIFTNACGYMSVQDLIVENVDYLTNAVALKLNAFDVSPQAPQVLLTMVRLAGPSLLPYLEDTIESIFAALEDYHGYPLLVELLFRCLGVIAVEGAKSPQLAIAEGPAAREVQFSLRAEQQLVTVPHLLDLLKERRFEERQSSLNKQPDLETHPKRPWKHITEEADDQSDTSGEADLEGEDMPVEDNEPPPPAPKTYNLLLKISDLTQHFLPAASVSLRSSLLILIQTTIPAIARHQNSFLPLVNTLWPEIVSRLDDKEPQVVVNTLEVIALLCEYAVDFMQSRILQLWPRLAQLWQEVTRGITNAMSRESSQEHSSKQGRWDVGNVYLRLAIAQMRSSPAEYVDTSTRTLWKSLVKTITMAVHYVGVPPEVFDEALEMMEPALDDDGVRSVFEQENSDAVWLLQARNRTADIPLPPSGDSYTFALFTS